MANWLKLVIAGIVIILIGLEVLPILVNGVNNANSISGISNYAGASATIGMIPLLFIGAIVVVVAIGIFFKKRGQN